MHTDIPTRAEVDRLMAVDAPSCVTLYTPTSRRSQERQGGRIDFKNQLAEAVAELRRTGAAADAEAIDEELTDLEQDYDFWAEQATSLAVFATPTTVRTHRLPNRIAAAVRVSDRFYVRPLLRAVSFPQAAFVLALSQGSARLVEITPDDAASAVAVPHMPADVSTAVGKASITDRSPSGRLQGATGQKVRMHQYARGVDRALRGVLAGRPEPLILACAPPLDAIFRAVCTLPQLVEEGIRGNPEALTDAELSTAGRTVLDAVHAAELDGLRTRFAQRASDGRRAEDLGEVARAATFGAVDVLLVDLDAHVPGTVGEVDGAVTRTSGGSPMEIGVTDEIARRTLLNGGRVVAVRADDLPGAGPVAAILRHAL